MIWAVFEQIFKFWGICGQKSKMAKKDCFEKVKIEEREKKNFFLRSNK